MAEIVQMLVEMGFSRNRAIAAVEATRCVDVQSAMEWLFNNQEDKPGCSKMNSVERKPGGSSSSLANQKSLRLVDEAWELIDPTPDIHALFIAFSKEFFWNKLGCVEVKWSPRMTSCAGVCSFKPKNRECIISLSQPLLKLRPRKDLVETLLHEMIHAYLFLDSGTTDREGHGEQFHYHMYRINNQTGTKISVYHAFRDEVKHYQTHWWKCDGPCQHRAPFFGIVKRSMNRAPGPSDFWHETHKQTCGGTFIKIREPSKEEPQKKPSANKPRTSILSPTSSNVNKKITDYFPGTPKNSSAGSDPTFKGIPSSVGTTTNLSSISTPSTSISMDHRFPGKGRKLNEDIPKPLNVPKKFNPWH